MKAVADTGFVVALVNRNDQYHEVVAPIYYQANQIFLPQSTLAEVAFLIQSRAGQTATSAFLRTLPSSKFSITALQAEDLERSAEILEKYADSRVDFVDASVMALAERLNLELILTLDQRDFRIFRPRHCDHFTLLPA